MRSRRPIPFSEHRLARFLAWFVMVLGWFVCGGGPARRQRRFGTITCATLRHAARALIVIRAADLHRARQAPSWRDFAPTGFHRRRKRCSVRAVGGAWLRKRLIVRSGLIAQAKHLITVLRNFEALARGLATHRRNGLTRLRPLVLVCAPALGLTIQRVSAPAIANSS